MRNDKGQIAIFVALIFQVLFILFAMAINVALIVHDKINLQNAVDLAAYYAAQRQAEIFNSIAHQNYQIRQAWKLYAWRIRVLGTMGTQNPMHPSNPTFRAPLSEVIYPGSGLTTQQYPLICIGFQPTWVAEPGTTGENICKARDHFHIPELPVIPVIAPWVGINAVINSASRSLRNMAYNRCEEQGVWNWWFAHAIKESFRQDQKNRKQVLYALADKLSENSRDFIDLDGYSVSQGVKNVINKNLTFSNYGETGASIEVFNSMGGKRPKDTWLKEISINPTSYFIDLETGGGCKSWPRRYPDLPAKKNNNAWNFVQTNLHGAELGQDNEMDNVLMPGNLSVGVEKNPWYMAYVGVKATTQTRNIFHPFGPPVTITAKAFAKPFGGRIGPWHKKVWPQGAPNSTGDINDQVDFRGPNRKSPGGLLDGPTDPRRIPNYSRFPGDPMGLSSVLAQASLKGIYQGLAAKKSYYYASYDTIQEGAANDPLAWDTQENRPPSTRYYEISAVAPDLFDITYYSVEPNYWQNYGSRIKANRNALGIPPTLAIRPDLGYRNGVDGLEGFNIQSQMNKIVKPQQVHLPDAFWYIRDAAHLLTAWLPQAPNLYPEDPAATGVFGKCNKKDYSEDPNKTDAPTVPGSCIWGGRVGYSVKLISEDYIRSQEHPMYPGGTGPLQNPPPEGW